MLGYRLLTVGLSCALTSVAGSFYTQYYFFVGPDQAFGSSVSDRGDHPGSDRRDRDGWGPLIGALVVGPLSDMIASILRNPPGFLHFLQGVTGSTLPSTRTLLIVIVLFMPKGVYGTIRDRWRR